MRLYFLGCGDDHGVPQISCDCQTCQHARTPDSYNHRTGPALAVQYGPPYSERTILIDAAPEVRLQVTNLNLCSFDALLITHGHDAHILGIGALARAQRRVNLPLVVHAPQKVLEDVQSRFGYLWEDKTYHRVWQPAPIAGEVDLWGLSVRAMRVNHGIGGTAYGYLFRYGDRSAAYIPDMLQAGAEVREALHGLDVLVLGASHYYEGLDLWKRSTMDIMYGMELIGEVQPQRAVFTHLSHTVDYDEISAQLPFGVQLAHDGLTVEVSE